MANRTLCGEKITLAILLVEQYSVGREILCWDIDDNSTGDTVVTLEVLMDFAGDKETSTRTIFPWLLAEDNPVISWWGNNL